MEKRNEINDIVDALYKLKIAVESLNPDPLQTIGQYRTSQTIEQGALIYSAVVSTGALIVSIMAVLH